MKKFKKLLVAILVTFTALCGALGLTSCGQFNVTVDWSGITDTLNKTQYTVTFDVNGGEGEVEEQLVRSGAKAVIPATAPTKEGHTFLGWYNGEEAWDFEAASVTENITLTAHWQIHTHTVTFNEDGTTTQRTVNYGSAVAKPADPMKMGYTFAGWTLNGVLYNFSTPVKGNIELVASWTINKYTVTFNVDGVKTTAAVNFGGTVTKPANPTKTGYI